MHQAPRRPSKPWHTLALEQLLSALETDPKQGLSKEQAEGRRARHGANELRESGLRGPATILWEQFTATLVLILIAAAVVAALLGEHKDRASLRVARVCPGIPGRAGHGGAATSGRACGTGTPRRGDP